MNINLSPALDSFVTRGVRDGLFVSADAAIEEGLLLLAKQTKLKQSFTAASEAELLGKLDAGIASLDAGQGVPDLSSSRVETVETVRVTPRCTPARAPSPPTGRA